MQSMLIDDRRSGPLQLKILLQSGGGTHVIRAVSAAARAAERGRHVDPRCADAVLAAPAPCRIVAFPRACAS